MVNSACQLFNEADKYEFHLKNIIMNYERANSLQTSLNIFEEEVFKLGLAYKLALTLPLKNGP